MTGHYDYTDPALAYSPEFFETDKCGVCWKSSKRLIETDETLTGFICDYCKEKLNEQEQPKHAA